MHSKFTDAGNGMSKLKGPFLVVLALLVTGCGEEEVDPNARPMCPDFSTSAKYDKPASTEERTLWNGCIPNDLKESQYHPIEKPALMVKMKNSRKMMQLKLSILTKHDFFAKLRMQTHDLALRSIFTERMLDITEEDTSDPGFRKALRADFKAKANELIREYEDYDFDLVADVLITSYVVE